MPDFPALQAALSTGDTEGLVCFVFDLLFEGAEDLRPLPLRERKARLEGLLGDIGDPAIRYVEHFETAGDAVLESACRMDLEGIVSKRLDAPYRSGRTGSWTKTKCRGGQEVVIGGWRADQGRLRSLLAGVYRDGRLVYAGRIGTGFSGATAAGLAQRLRNLAADDSPFAEGPRPAKDVHWVRPELVAEIEHGGFTDAGLLRHAAFKALREDKPAREVSPEAGDEVESGKPARRRSGRDAHNHVVLGVTISNPDKAIWPAEGDRPAITKLELARYYEVAGPLVLPHVADRPCSLVRTPDGIGGQHFYQRHAMPGTSSLIELVKIRGDRKPYLQFSRPEALVAAAQSGAVELHPWNCAPGDPERPGRYVFDLDPGPDVPFDAVIMAAQEIRERLAAIGLTGWCKTTGGKGLHVVVPLSRSRKAVSWPEAKALAAAICREMAEDSPDRHLVNMAKRLRKGRIFLDYLRNDRTATAVAPYSARARPGAPVSLPVRWEDVRPGLDPARFDVPAMMASLAAKHRKHSPWTGYEESARPLDQAIRQHGRQSAGPSTARRRAGSPPAPRQGRGASAGSTAAAR